MSDEDNDDFAFYGTAVEQLDEDNFTTKKAPRLEDQTATDKQGRRRFHGAFTGGFSAGHFNTVGSVEGFTPVTFTSSRTERNKEKFSQNIEMYMDEEDLSAHGIAAQRLQPAAEFGGGASKRKRVMPNTGPIPGTPVLLDLTVNTSESVGVRLLRRLGWREGQGVGPRLSLKQKRRSRASKQTLTEGARCLSDSDSELPSQYSGATFAPDDCGSSWLPSVGRKNDTFGLGYKPLSREGVLSSKAHQSTPFAVTEKKKTMTIKGQAFGVGAFEEEDEDIYTTEDMSHYNFTMGGPSQPADADKDGRQAKAFTLGVGSVCELLEGFVLSTAPVQPSARPALPRLPPDYVPQHRPLRKRFSNTVHHQSGLGRHDLGPDDRRRMRDGAAASVEVRTGVKGEKPPTPPPAPALPPLPSELFTDEESTSRHGYQPFASDRDKQKRYSLYLRMKEKGLASRYSEVQPAALTEWERDREVREFERAAQLYKPLTSAMATRFVSSSATESAPLLKDGLNMSIKRANPVLAANKESALADISENAGPSPALSSDPRMKAAQTSMFGRLTLSVQRWHPDKLLCRRFNVPSPYPDSRHVGVVSDAGGSDRHHVFDQPPPPRADRPPDVGTQGRPSSQGFPDGFVDEVETKVAVEETPEMYGLKVPVTGPPTMDLFKAIFEGSSSSGDSTDSDSDGGSADRGDSSCSPAGRNRGAPDASPPPAPHKEPPARRVRKSRFEPRQEDLLTQAGSETGQSSTQSTDNNEPVTSELPKHVFISQKHKTQREPAENGLGKYSSKNKKKSSSSVVKSSLSFAVESDESEKETGQKVSKRVSDLKLSSVSTSQKDAEYKSSSNDLSENDRNSKASQGATSDLVCDIKPPTLVDGEDVLSCRPHQSETTSFKNEKPSFSNVHSKPAASSSELSKPTKLSQSRALGIFADIDFTELNKYREYVAEPSTRASDTRDAKAADGAARRPVLSVANTTASETVRKVMESAPESSDDSSLDSDEAYGAALPPNFVSPLQVVRDRSSALVSIRSGDDKNFIDARLAEKSKKSDSKHKTKKKKSEKKKKHKKKFRKESKKNSKEKRKRRERCDSSSSSSDE